MVRHGGMERIPTSDMAAGTIATGGEVLTYRGADQSSISIVTAGAAIVGFGSGADQGIVMTVHTVGRRHLNQCSVVRCVGDVGRFPSTGVAGGTVTAGGEILADGQADQHTGTGIVTTGTVIMGFGGRTD